MIFPDEKASYYSSKSMPVDEFTEIACHKTFVIIRREIFHLLNGQHAFGTPRHQFIIARRP
mgnify:FL=1